MIAEGYSVIGHLSSTKEDRLVKKYLDGKVPFLPPVVTMFEKVTPKLEHGVGSLVQLLQAVIKMMCIQPAFEEHVVWFMDINGTIKENHIEMGSYYDAYTIQGMLATTMLTIVLFNMPWLVHMPQFNFPYCIFKDGEACTSKDGQVFLNKFQTELTVACKHGVDVVFFVGEYPEGKTIPGTRTLLSGNEGKHHFSLNYVNRGDLKSQFGVAGSKATNMTYLPHIKMSKKEMNDPSVVLTPELFRTHEERIAGFELQEKFREGQKVKLDVEVVAINENSTLSDEEKSKRCDNAVNRLMKIQVSAYAVSLYMPLYHFLPLIIAESAVLCLLHMDCNEWQRVFERLMSTASDATLEECCEEKSGLTRVQRQRRKIWLVLGIRI